MLRESDDLMVCWRRCQKCLSSALLYLWNCCITQAAHPQAYPVLMLYVSSQEDGHTAAEERLLVPEGLESRGAVNALTATDVRKCSGWAARNIFAVTITSLRRKPP